MKIRAHRKKTLVIGILTVAVCISSSVAQFVINGRGINQVGEAQVRTVASRLTIGMREEDAIGLLASNGLKVTASQQDTNLWFRIYCYTNGDPSRHSCGLSLEFRQKPGPTGLIISTNSGSSNRTTKLFEAMTNGILHAALLDGVQIAQTNAPKSKR